MQAQLKMSTVSTALRGFFRYLKESCWMCAHCLGRREYSHMMTFHRDKKTPLSLFLSVISHQRNAGCHGRGLTYGLGFFIYMRKKMDLPDAIFQILRNQQEAMRPADYDVMFKILLIGNSAVGKSSFLLRFAEHSFQQTFHPSIGVDFRTRIIEDQEGIIIKLQIWDTAGQERYRAITTGYLRGAHGIIIMFDLANQQSFRQVQRWLIDSGRYSSSDVVRILVGNKSDLVEQRQVSRQQAEEYADREGMRYYQSSVRLNQNVDKVFRELASSLKERLQPSLEGPRHKTSLQSIRPKNAQIYRTCC